MPLSSNLRSPSASRAVIRAARRSAAFILELTFALTLALLASASLAQAACLSTRVALDVGHTPAKPGAISASGVPEFRFNRALADAVAAALQHRGIASVRLNPAAREVTLKTRTRKAQAAGATVFLSLHHDSAQPHYLATAANGYASTDRFRGYSLFISGRNAKALASRRLADSVGAALRQAGFVPSLHHAEPIPGENRPLLDAGLGIYRFDDLVVLRTAPMPALLIEAGIIVNPAEEPWLASAEGRARLAEAIASGVVASCRD
jgi:N-acetylmuramoyl-L-alanine amidase